MPDWWPKLLLLVFATHLPFFAVRWWRTGEHRHAATTLTFILLVITYALRVFAPRFALGTVACWEVARVSAWLAAGLSISLLALHHVRRRRAP